MSFRKYRAIDITIFTIIYLILELVVTKAATSWFQDQPYSVSLLLPLTLILIMRWDYFAIIDIVLFPLYFVFISSKDATLIQYLIYLFGNLSLIIPTFLIKKVGKEKIRSKWINSLIYVVASYILLELFRGIGATIFSSYNPSIIFQYLLTDSFNLVFSILIILVARMSNGMFMDQKTYLLELEKERKKNGNLGGE